MKQDKDNFRKMMAVLVTQSLLFRNPCMRIKKLERKTKNLRTTHFQQSWVTKCLRTHVGAKEGNKKLISSPMWEIVEGANGLCDEAGSEKETAPWKENGFTQP